MYIKNWFKWGVDNIQFIKNNLIVNNINKTLLNPSVYGYLPVHFIMRFNSIDQMGKNPQNNKSTIFSSVFSVKPQIHSVLTNTLLLKAETQEWDLVSCTDNI